MAEGKRHPHMTNPQTSQVENVNPIWGPTHPLPEIKAAQVMSSTEPDGMACFLSSWEPRVWRGKEELLPNPMPECRSAGQWKQVTGSWRDASQV